ncbi:MAG: Smr/MutS family protein, partial [Gemmatimonadota bacterium]
ARQQARDLLLNARQEVEQAIAELRELVERGGDPAAFDEAATAARRRVERAATRQSERAPDRPEREREAPSLEVGASVRVAATGARGTVVELRDDRATVEVSGLRLDVKAADLERVQPPKPKKEPGARAGAWSGPRVEASSEVHLLGLRAEEVAGRLHPALDAAIQAGLPSLTVVHGKGAGILREVVAELLEQDPRVSSYRAGRIGEGGTGVTVADLE